MNKKKYTSGEIASAAGLTVRAIQHYDNIGLLPSAGRTEGGRRYYTEDDFIRLEQIILYRSLGFSLEQIKKRILLRPNQKELQNIFKDQQLLLLEKMEHLHTSFITIGIMSEILESGKEVPISLFLQFLNALPEDDIFSQAPYRMTQRQKELLSKHLQDLELIRQFYHNWKEIILQAMVLLSEGKSPESTETQDLVKRWWCEIIGLTKGDLELVKQLSELHLEEQMLIKKESILTATQQFMDKALEIFLKEDRQISDKDKSPRRGENDDRGNKSDQKIRKQNSR